jgi:hypothetical protein
LCGTCIAGELQDIEEVIFSTKQITTARDWLVKLGLLEKWTPEGEEKLIIDKDGGLSEMQCSYRTANYAEIESICLTWGNTKRTEDGHTDLVTGIEVVDKNYYYVYSWRDNGYVQIKTRKREVAGDTEEKDENVHKSTKPPLMSPQKHSKTLPP